MGDLSTGLRTKGVPASRIHTEVFGSLPPITPGIAKGPSRLPHQPPVTQEPGPTVSFARTGLTVSWASRYQNLLELAEACGYSRKMGVPDGSVPHLRDRTYRRRGELSNRSRLSPLPSAMFWCALAGPKRMSLWICDHNLLSGAGIAWLNHISIPKNNRLRRPQSRGWCCGVVSIETTWPHC